MPQGISQLLSIVWLAAFLVASVATPLFHDTAAHSGGQCCASASQQCHSHQDSAHQHGAGHDHDAGERSSAPSDGNRQHDSCAACRFLAQPSTLVVFVAETTAAEFVARLIPIPSPAPRDISLALHHSRAPPQGG